MGLINTKHPNKKPTRVYSSKQEKEVAKTLNGKTTLNSGATAFSKGDIILDDFLLDCKTKTKPSESISIKKEWLETLNKNSLFMGKPYWSLVFNYGENQSNYYVINQELFDTLVEKIKNNENNS